MAKSARQRLRLNAVVCTGIIIFIVAAVVVGAIVANRASSLSATREPQPANSVSATRNEARPLRNKKVDSQPTRKRKRRQPKIVPEPKTLAEVRQIDRFAVSPDRKSVVIARHRLFAREKKLSEYEVAAWDLRSGRKLRDFEAPVWVTGAIRFSPDGRLLAARLRNNAEIRIWDVQTGTVLRHFRSGANFITSGFGFSFDSRMLVVTAAYNFMVLDLETGVTRVFPFQSRDLPRSMAVSPTGPYAAVGRWNLSIRRAFIDLIDLRTLSRICTLESRNGAIGNLAFSADGNTLVAAGPKSTIMLVDTGNWKVRKTLRRAKKLFGHSSRQYLRLVVSRNGAFIAGTPMYSGRPKAELWNVKTRSVRQLGKVVTEDLQFIGNSSIAIADRTVGLSFCDTKTGDKTGPPEPIPFLTPRKPPDPFADLPAAQRLIAYRKAGEFQKAINVGASLVQADIAAASRDPSALRRMRALAEAYRAAGDFDKAVPIFQKCLSVSEAIVVKATTTFASDLDNLMRTYVSMGRWKQAAEFLEATVKSRATRLGKDHPAVAHAEFELGMLFRLAGDWGSARQHFAESLRIRNAAGAPAADLANSQMWTGTAQTQLLNFVKAAPLLEKAVTTLQTVVKRPNAKLSEARFRLVDAYRRSGEKEKLKAILTALFKDVKKLPESDSPAIVYTLSQMARYLTLLRRYNESEVMLHKAQDIVRRLYGPNDVAVANFYSEMASNDWSVGLNQTANLYQHRAISIYRKLFGDDFPRKAHHLELLGRTYLKLAKFDTAHDYFRRAVNAADTATVDGQESATRALVFRYDDYASRRKLDDALPLCDLSIRRAHRDMAHILPLLPDASKARYAERNMATLDFAVSIVYDASRAPGMRPAMQKWIDRSAEWVINMKGLPSEILANRTLLLRDAADGKTRALAQELSTVRNRIAARTAGNIGRFTFGEQADVVKELLQRERQLSAALGRRMGPRAVGVPWITVDAVRRKLPRDTVLMEFVKFNYRRYQNRLRLWRIPESTGAHYVAWVIPPAGEGSVRFVWLAAASDAEHAISDFRETMTRDRDRGDFSLTGIAASANTMSSQVLHRAIEPMMKYKRWILSPDASLWLVPWGATRTLDKKYVIRSREICTVTASRSLLRKSIPVKATAPVIVANPNYNLGLPAGVTGFGGFLPLPGTANEAQAVAPQLAKLAGAKPAIYLQEKATEKVVKSFKSPRVALFATHGFFDRGSRSIHPLLRTGLALAGANSTATAFFNNPKNQRAANGNDGILTALEVVGLDFRGTQLVMLSACETGLGTVHRGQGIAGLHQAFRLAGAKSVAATLWQIPDKQTALLSAEMFKQLAAGKRPTEALRVAQLSMLNGNGSQHPFFWAAFTISGFAK